MSPSAVASRGRHWRLFAAGLLLFSSVVVVSGPDQAEATTVQPFADRFSTNDNGAIGIFGNSLMTCRTDDIVNRRTCKDVRAGTASSDLNNNSWVMVNIDEDGSNFPATYNSSNAVAEFPSGDSVLWAGLYWGARLTKGDQGAAAPSGRDQMRLRGPGDTAYRTITSQDEMGPTSTSDRAYQQFADVTAIVQALGPGTYWGANVAAATGKDRYAGWAMVVVYRDSTLPLRNLSVFDGLADVGDDDPQSVDISGFLAPLAGTVDAQLGMVSYEGDLGSSGDTAFLEGTRLGTTISPGTNFFNSSNDRNGTIVGDGNPSHRNMLGFDLKAIGAPDVIPNGATDATFEFASSAERYYPGVLTTAINLYSPDFTPSTKQVVNLDGNDPARPGDTLEYTLSFVNAGQDPATDSVADDPLPAGVTYVPGSLEVISGDDPGPKTDAAGDDEAEFLTGSNTVRFRVGAGATASAGGTIAAEGGSTELRFRVTVDDVDARTTVINRAELDYVADTIGDPFTYIGNEVPTVVQPVADLSVEKVTAPDPAVAGANFTSTITVTNDGPNTARQVSVIDLLPEGTIFVSADTSQGSCSRVPGTVTCELGALAAGSTATVTVTSRIPSGSTLDSITNNASVSSAVTPDPDENDNSVTSTAAVTRESNLVVEKIPLDADVVPGTTTTFQITVRNDGPSDAVDLALDDTLGAGLTIVGSTIPPGATCEPRPDGFHCTAPSLAAGAEFTGTIEALVPAGATAAADNSASIGAATADPDTSDNTATASVPLAPPQADLSLTKFTSGEAPVAGSHFDYTISFANNGPSDATGVDIEDLLPVGLTAVSVSSTRGECVLGPPVSCDIGTLNQGAQGQVHLVVEIGSDVLGTVSNTATIASDASDPDGGDNTSTALLDVTGVADLGVSKQGEPNPVVAGGQATYTVTVSNDGPSTARDVTIADTLPNGFVYVADSASPSQGTCEEPEGGVLSCDLGDLGLGGTATVTFVMNVPASFTGSDTNTVTVDSATPDPIPDNDSAEALSSVVSTADLFVIKTADPEPLTAGAGFIYSIEVGNPGPSDALDVEVVDVLPEGVTAESTDACTVEGQLVTCIVGTIPGDFSVFFNLNAQVEADVAGGTRLTNVATVATSTPDRDSSNNTAVWTSTVQTQADVSVTKSIEPPSGVEGEFSTWTMTVANEGPSVARDVAFIDIFEWFYTGTGSFTVDGEVVECALQPDGTTTCTVPGIPDFLCVALVTGELECTLGDFDPGEEMVIEMVNLLFNAPPVGDYLNTATVASSTPDTDASNDRAEATFSITGYSADLEVTKTAPDELVAGTEFSYEITWQNNGPSTAFDVLIEDTLPDTLIPSSVTSSNGSCDLAGQSFSCQVGNTPWVDLGGFTGTIVVTGTVAPDASGAIENTATIESPISADPDPSNNSSISTSTVTRSADVSVFKTADAETAAGGGTIIYRFGALNEGPSTAENVVVEETLPPGAALIIFEDPPCTPTPSGTIECDFGTLEPGEQAESLLEITFASDFEGDTTDTATGTSDTPDPDGDDLVAEVTTPVERIADLRVTKTPSAPTAVAGGELTYNIVLANNGPSSAAEVELIDEVPAGTTLVSVATEPAITCELAGGTLTCPVGTLEPGASQSLVVTVALSTDLAPGELANTARADSPTVDPNPETRIATASVQVTVESDLEVIKTTLTDPVVAGQPVTYRFDVVNQGPSAAPDVLISDLLSDGTSFQSSTASQGSCGAVTQEGLTIASCELGRIAPGGTANATITLATDPDIRGTLGNLAVVGSGALDSLDGNNTSEVGDQVEVPADLSIEKSGPATIDAAGSGTYTLTYRNNGPGTATGVVVTETVPDGLTPTPPRGCTFADGVVTCSIGTVAPGTGGILEIPVQVDEGLAAGTELTDVARITGDQIDDAGGNNEDSVTSTVRRATNVAVTVVADRDTTAPGGPGGYLVTVTNEGPLDATGVTLVDTLPPQLASVRLADALVVSRSPLLVAPLNVGTDCTIGDGVVTCAVGELAVGQSVALRVNGTAAPSTASGTELALQAEVSIVETDVDPADDTAEDVILVEAQPATTTTAALLTTTSATPDTLPNTGRMVAGLIGLALALLALGSVVAVAVRRRSA